MPYELAEDLALAEDAVRAAAGAAAAERAAGEVAYKASAADPVVAADRAAERAIVSLLRSQRPDDGLLGEEGADVSSPGRRWVIDGLDGTANFVLGLPHWCSAVALEDADGPAVAAIYDPLRDELFSAGRGLGSRLNDRELRIATPGAALETAVVATFFRRDLYEHDGVPQGLDRAARACASLRIMGSGGIELGWVAAGRLDGWAQARPQPWDWLAGSLLVREAGGACREDVGIAGWAIAGPAALVAALAGVLEGG
jgi:fructose-1,6-bisphosphatase/inositol monophosphatase family enzyme